MVGHIEILSPGLYSSIQDTGRYGYLSYGVPIGGAMDRYSHKLANMYLHNPQEAATLEITYIGPTLKFTHTTEIVLVGADLSPTLNNNSLQHSVVTRVQGGDVLSFGTRQDGCRTYLGIKGGFQTDKVLGSRSSFETITKIGRLEKNMKIPYLISGESMENTAVTDDQNARINEEKFDHSDLIEVFPGPEYNQLTQRQQKVLLSSSFQVSPNNNRMGVQLEKRLANELQPIITGPVMPGTVQLTPSGTLIVLMRDCQTTGGYPRVLQLTRHGINQLAQRVTAEEIKWSLRSLA